MDEPMPRYTQEQKDQALAMIENKGVTKTAENLGINKQTLYKWKNAGKATSTEGADDTSEKKATSKVSKVVTEAAALVTESNTHLAQENDRLMNEIFVLRKENEKLKKTIQALTSLIMG